MAVPNQNNINDIIKSQINSINSTIKIIVDAAASKVIKRASAEIQNLKQYQTIINTVFNKDGLFENITSAINMVGNSNKSSKIKLYSLKANILKISDLTNVILSMDINAKKIKKSIDAIKSMNNVYAELPNVIDTIDKINIPQGIFIKMRLIKRILKRVARLRKTLNLLNAVSPLMITGLLSLSIIQTYALKLAETFESLNSIDVKLSTFIKLLVIPKIIKFIKNVIDEIRSVANILGGFKGLKNIYLISWIFSILKEIFEEFDKIHISMFYKLKFKRILNSLSNTWGIVFILSLIDIRPKHILKAKMISMLFEQLGDIFKTFNRIIIGPFYERKFRKIDRSLRRISTIIWRINRIRVRPKHILKLILLQSLFINLGLLFSSIILVSPLAILVVPALALLVLGIIALRIATNILAKVISGMVNGALIKGILFLLIISSFYLLLSALFLTIAIKAKPVVESTLYIVGLLGVITLVTIGTIALGLLMSLLTPIMIPTIIGLGIVLAVIGILTLMALMLSVIQKINLDSEKIKENVKTVIDTSRMVVETIFNNDDKDSEESKKSWIESIVEFIGGSLVTVIKAIMAVAFLAVMVVAILLILLIASQLKLIEMIDLNKEKVIESVDTVIGTALTVVEALFNRKENDTEGTKKSWIESVIEFVGGGLVSIMKAIISIQFLAISIVAILLVTIIAGQLKLIEKIELDSEKITSNVDLTINTVQKVIDAITTRKDTDTEGSKKSWIKSLLEFVGVGGLLNIVDAIMSIAWLGFAIAVISLVKVLAEQLSTIGSIQLSEDINKKVDDIVLCANSVTTAITNREDPLSGSGDEKKTSFIKSIFPGLAGAAEMMSRMRWLSSVIATVGMIKELSTTLLELNNLPDLSNTKNNVTKIFNSVDEIVFAIQSKTEINEDNVHDRIKGIQKVISSINNIYDVEPKTLKGAKKILENNNNFVKQIDNINITKLETASNLFKGISKVSNEINLNFEKMADVISEDLMPVLLELKNTMNTVPEKLEVGFQNTSASIGAVSAPATKENVTAQTLRENPNLTKEEVNKIVSTRMNDKALADANGVSAKLDELISLLKGFGGEQVVVRTI